MSNLPTTRALVAQPLTREAFFPFGAILRARPDGTPVTEDEGLLDLAAGRPRFYLMELADKPPRFRTITRHRRTTQSLLSVGGASWIIAVAPPEDLDDPGAEPDVDRIVAFEVPGDVAVLLHRGTWHSGPHFAEPVRTFANLELADTNIVDHHTFRLDRERSLQFEITAPEAGIRKQALI
ncbi:ureidoglycolate lyase [Nocardia sp. NPDC024068]|uniref:ureidoglycolate lyase n=1 Tax=Nocardia sp. NPDC024068 TaxID=3157197 RepID=UPI0033CAB7C8